MHLRTPPPPGYTALEFKIERLCGGTAGYRVTEYATEFHIFNFVEMKVLIKTLQN